VSNVITNVHHVGQLLSIALDVQKIENKMPHFVLAQLDTLMTKRMQIRFVSNVLGNVNLVLGKPNYVCLAEGIDWVKLVLVLQVSLRMVLVNCARSVIIIVLLVR